MNCVRVLATAALAAVSLSSIAVAQPAAGRGGRGGPAVVSPEVLTDGRITFRVLAPDAAKVTFMDNDGITSSSSLGPPPAGGTALAKNQNGIWEATYGPLPAGAYRYAFQVDGVKALDPANTHTSESNTAIWSLFTVPGSPLMDTRDVPHGAVASVFYYSALLKTTRRMHISTPPPGQTGMPGAARSGAGSAPAVNPFTGEFMTDVIPYVESHYRTINDRAHRAIAGLSMGGAQTLDIAFQHFDKFGYIGVFSSGAILGGGRRGPTAPAQGAAPAAAPAAPPQPDWETVHKADPDNAAPKKGLKLIWLSTDVNDRLITNTRTTVELLKKHGFEPVFKESPGVHSWLNWRNYLIEFAPKLF